MKRYEYMILQWVLPIGVEGLNRWGEEGWHLSTATFDKDGLSYLIFARLLPNEEPAS